MKEFTFDRPTKKPQGMSWEAWRVIALRALIDAGESIVDLLEASPGAAAQRRRGRPPATDRQKALQAARARQLNAGIAFREAIRAVAGALPKDARTRLLEDTAMALNRSTKTVQDMMRASRRRAR